MCSSIAYSSKAFRWYPGNDDTNNQEKLEQITNWWKGLSSQKVQQYHITGIELNQTSGEWKSIQQNLEQFKIQNTQLKTNKSFQAVVSFTKEDVLQTIEAICIDFDPQQKFIIIYPPNGVERYIFCK